MLPLAFAWIALRHSTTPARAVTRTVRGPGPAAGSGAGGLHGAQLDAAAPGAGEDLLQHAAEGRIGRGGVLQRGGVVHLVGVVVHLAAADGAAQRAGCHGSSLSRARRARGHSAARSPSRSTP